MHIRAQVSWGVRRRLWGGCALVLASWFASWLKKVTFLGTPVCILRILTPGRFGSLVKHQQDPRFSAISRKRPVTRKLLRGAIFRPGSWGNQPLELNSASNSLAAVFRARQIPPTLAPKKRLKSRLWGPTSPACYLSPEAEFSKKPVRALIPPSILPHTGIFETLEHRSWNTECCSVRQAAKTGIHRAPFACSPAPEPQNAPVVGF